MIDAMILSGPYQVAVFSISQTLRRRRHDH